jgi:hypothetical protein
MLGVNAFYYDWSLRGLNWIFVAPRLIFRAIGHLKLCKATAFLLVPQWKTRYFYPFLFKLKNTTAYKKHLVYWGEKIFSCLVLMSTVILDLLTVEMWSLYITE